MTHERNTGASCSEQHAEWVRGEKENTADGPRQDEAECNNPRLIQWTELATLKKKQRKKGLVSH